MQTKWQSWQICVFEFVLLLNISLFAFILRFNSFSRASEIDWDESTFITVAQRLFGHHELPFTSTFEVKPPLAYLLYGLPSVFGVNSLWIYRIIATLVVALSAYSLSLFYGNRRAYLIRLFAASSYVFIFSILPVGLAWMTELNTALPLIWIYLLAKKPKTRVNSFAIGILAAVLVLTRTNMIFVFFSILAYFWITAPSYLRKKRISFFVLGWILPFLIVFLAYFSVNESNLLWIGLIELPRSIIASTNPFDFQVGVTLIFLIVSSLIPLLVPIMTRIRSKTGSTNENTLLLLCLHLAVIFGVLFSHPMYGHHLLQLAPLPVITFLEVVDQRFEKFSLHVNSISKQFAFLISVSLLVCGFIAAENLPRLEIKNVDYVKTEMLVSQVSKIEKGMNIQTIWSPDANFLYYRLNKTPSSPIVIHPVNLVTPSIRRVYANGSGSFVQSLKYVIDSKPDMVVISSQSTYFSPSQLKTIKAWIDKYYNLVPMNNSHFQIYHRGNN